MKIAIITLPLHGNYGGILQNYALQTVLKRMGHTVETLRLPQERKQPLWRRPLVYSKRFIWKYVLHRPCHIFYEQWYNAINPPLIRHMQAFVDRHIEARQIKDFKELKEGEYHAFVVGSDQIWRRRSFKCYQSLETVYLSFAKDWKGICRVAYAPSFGTDQWEYSAMQTRRCAALAKCFDGISVRESSAVDLCKQYLGMEALHVLDPTMLLRAKDYLRLLEGVETHQPDGQLLTYILDETAEKNEIVNRIARHYGYRSFRANSRYEDLFAPLEERVQPPVEQWLKDFNEACFIVTDSFHATVFSILFGKPFVVIGNKARGLARIYSLLEMLHLEEHIVNALSELDLTRSFEYDAQSVHSLLQAKRNESMNFLEKMIGHSNH